MLIEDAMVAAVDVLLAEQIPFMIVGSFSTNYYGIPRATEDGDLVVELGRRPICDVTSRLGPSYRLDPQTAFDSVTGSLRHIVDIVDTGFKIEFFRLSSDPHDLERFARRILQEWRGRQAWLPTPEDVIIMKLRWASHQHGTRKLMEEVKGTVPKV